MDNSARKRCYGCRRYVGVHGRNCLGKSAKKITTSVANFLLFRRRDRHMFRIVGIDQIQLVSVHTRP